MKWNKQTIGGLAAVAVMLSGCESITVQGILGIEKSVIVNTGSQNMQLPRGDYQVQAKLEKSSLKITSSNGFNFKVKNVKKARDAQGREMFVSQAGSNGQNFTIQGFVESKSVSANEGVKTESCVLSSRQVRVCDGYASNFAETQFSEAFQPVLFAMNEDPKRPGRGDRGDGSSEPDTRHPKDPRHGDRDNGRPDKPDREPPQPDPRPDPTPPTRPDRPDHGDGRPGHGRPGDGGWDRPGHGRPGNGGWDRPGHDRPGHGRPGNGGWDRPGHDRPGHGRPGDGGWDRPGHDRPGHGRPGHGRPGHDRPGHGGWDRPGWDRPGWDRPDPQPRCRYETENDYGTRSVRVSNVTTYTRFRADIIQAQQRAGAFNSQWTVKGVNRQSTPLSACR